MAPTLHRLLGTDGPATQPTSQPATQPATQPINPAIVPTSRDDRTYRRDHPRFQRKAAKGGFPILFLGDSITEMWLGPGLDTWKKRYRPRDAENFGLSADRTPTMLHRLADGELEGKLDPKVIVLMVGTNNLDSEFCKMTPAQTVGGVRAVLDLLARKLPRSRVLLLGLLPREPHKTGLDAKIRRTNELLATLADGKRVVYLDFSDAFRGPDGQADPKMFREDMLHPSPKGYETWGRLMEPTLAKMLAEAASQPARTGDSE
jgi:beta-glucosidase